MRPPENDEEREVRELLARAERPVIVPPFSSVERRRTRTRLVPALVAATLVIVAAAAMGLALRDLRASSAPATSPAPSASGAPATASPAVSAVPSAQAAPAAPLSDRYGVIVSGRQSSYLRSETDPKTIASFSTDLSNAVVSPNGRMIAYWAGGGGGARVLMLIDLAAPAAARTLLTLPASEVAATSTFGGVAWSSDGTGLLIAVNSTEYVKQPVPDALNLYATLRQLDLPSGSVKEIARKELGFPFYPLAWDRARRISAAVEWGPGGFATSYVTVRDDGSLQRAALPGTTLPRSVRAAPDASRVLSRSFYADDAHAVYVWPLADPAQRTTLTAAGSDRVVEATWRDGREIVASVTSDAKSNDGQRLEVWPLQGTRRVVLTAPHVLEAVRPDGTAAITTAGVVDLALGTFAAMPADPGRGVSGSVSLAPSVPATAAPAQLSAITGRLGYQSDFIPPLTVYAISKTDSRWPRALLLGVRAGVGAGTAAA